MHEISSRPDTRAAIANSHLERSKAFANAISWLLGRRS